MLRKNTCFFLILTLLLTCFVILSACQKEPNVEPQPPQPEQPQTITNTPPTSLLPDDVDKASITVIGLDGEIILPELETMVSSNGTVFNMLRAAGMAYDLDVDFIEDQGLATIKGIKGLNEFAKGPDSGWVCYINEQRLAENPSERVVKPDDKVVWQFVTDGYTQE